MTSYLKVSQGDEDELSLHEDGEAVSYSFESFEEEKIPRDWKTLLKYTSLLALVVQNAGQAFIMRYAKTRDDNKFLNTVAIFFNEILKLLISLIIFFIISKSTKNALKELKYHFITNFWDSLKVGVPALIYTIQNILLYIAIENLDASTFMITYQTKILTAAAFTVLLLKKKLSTLQWASLFALIAGIILVQLNPTRDIFLMQNDNSTAVNLNNSVTQDNEKLSEMEVYPLLGLLAVVTACILSGFAGIYFEKILKGSEVSLWMRSVQLAVFSIPCCAALIAIKDSTTVLESGFMQGFDGLVWILVIVHAAGGLIVAAVIKYADNILKAFATSMAIFLAIIGSSAVTAYFYHIFPSVPFLIGAILVVLSVIVYGMFPYVSIVKPSLTKVDLISKA